MAQMCYDTKRYGAAARFWVDALTADSTLANDQKAEHRYNAACAAALAGSAQGKDDLPTDDAAMAKLRLQALAWLRADFALRATQLKKGTVEAQQEVQRVVSHWTEDSDLAGVRDQGAWPSSPKLNSRLGVRSGMMSTRC